MKHHAPIAGRPGRFREECFSLLLWAGVLCAWLLTRSVAAEPPRVDLFGDPLPERAVARMGTVRFRVDIPMPMPRYSPDGEQKDGKRNWTIGNVYWLSAMAISPDGTLIATAIFTPDSAVARDRAMIQVRDFRTGEWLFNLRGHTGAIRSLAFTPDGAKLISASQDTTLLVWDVRPGD